MYEENKKNINWGKIVVEIFICLLVFILSIKLINIIITRAKTNNINEEYNEKLSDLDKFAKDYFKESLPTKSGENKIVYLNSLVNEDKIKNIDKCDMEKSYIKVIKLDSEYQIKTYLTCHNYENYLNTFIDITKNTTTKPVASTTTNTSILVKKTTTKAKTKKTTKKITVNKTNYNISFNTNGGNIINDMSVIENSQINPPTPVREGYKFIGWYYHGSQFNFSTRINQNYVFTARWVKE